MGSGDRMPDRAGFALGKREPLPERRALMLSDVLTGVTPAVPTAVDHFAAVPGWELGANDRFGTCGPTSVANLIRLVSLALTGTMTTVTLDDVFDLYRRSGTRGFDPTLSDGDPRQDDNGVYLHVMLEQLLADGIGGRKPVAFAKIAAGDTDTLNTAIAIFGGVILGLDLKVAQQRQDVWDNDPTSGDWGGHAVVAGLYRDPEGTSEDRTAVVTWADVQDMTRRFVDVQEDEAWVVIWPEHLGSAAFLEGVDQQALADAYRELTGDPFPVPVSPAPPAPVPGSGPVPADGVDGRLEAALRRFLTHHEDPHYLVDAARAWLETRP
jgi:hypothetical protein